MSASHEQEATASALDQITDLDTPLEILLAKETLQKFDDLFRNDENAQMVLMGKLDNLSAAEIQEVAGLSAVEYASLLRSIRRRYDKLTVKE
jgi:DNA-directed RNA polymerase specialized sigma24 family protein